MIFKMRRDYAAPGIVRRVLNGAEIRNVHVLRYDDKAAWVLTCRTLNSDESLRKAVFLDLCNLYAAFLKVFFNIAISGLLGKSSNSSGAENMIRAEELFRVFMRLCLHSGQT